MNIAIIGSGLAGLTAATKLKDFANVTVFEKSLGVSGRLSTRNADPYFFDHGAQYFKIKSDEFKEFVSPIIQEGFIKKWDARFVEIKNRKIIRERDWDEKNIHYVGVPGMNSIGKYLAHGLNIKFDMHVQSIHKDKDKWYLKDQEGSEHGYYDWIIITAPAPQTLNFIDKNSTFYKMIESIKMSACYSLMLGFDKPLPLSFDAAHIYGDDLSWISVNSSKPGRNNKFCLLINSTNEWANQNINNDREEIKDYLIKQSTKVLGHDLNTASHKVIHGWRYANTDFQQGEKYLIDKNKNIAICGDWLIQGRVEAAYTSGSEMTKKLLKIIL